VVQLTVGPGPTPSSSTFNVPTVSITLCVAGTSNCKVISNILVDTGSWGLRLLHSALSGLPLAPQADPNAAGNVIAECLMFADGYTWGEVATADLTIGGEKASNLPVNIINDDATFAAAPSSCSSSAPTNIGTAAELSANGLLGVGVFATDCGDYCAQPVVDQTTLMYYTCTTGGTCTGASEPLTSQVINPVALFPTDNNGVIMQLPSIPATGQTTDTGFLVFGIGTESNNALNGVTVLTTDDAGNIITMFNSQTMTSSFIDSGSNGLYFPDPAPPSSIPKCTGFPNASEFYCPTSTLSLTATNQGQNGNTTAVPFQIANLNNLSNSDFALNDVGGPTGTTIGGNFDFGVPFFYGRTVFTAIYGQPADGTDGPYVAY
jgi:uncharacterized protein DUF3443